MRRPLLSLGLLALTAAIPASATTLTFGDRTEFESAVTSLSNFDSGTQAAGTYTNFNTSAGLVITDLQIIGYTVTGTTGYDLTRVNANGSQPYYQWNSGSILRGVDKTDTNTVFMRLNFLTPVNAFGFNFGAGGGGGAPGNITVTVNGADPVNLVSNTFPSLAFWGIASDTQAFSFADIYINDTNRYLVLDNIERGVYTGSVQAPPTETPEAGTFVHLAMGVGLLSLARFRFRRTET